MSEINEDQMISKILSFIANELGSMEREFCYNVLNGVHSEISELLIDHQDENTE